MSGIPPFEGALRLPRSSTGPGRTIRTIAIVLVLFLVFGPPIASRIADWLWYKDVGFERVFLTKIVAQWVLGLAAGVGGFVVLFTNARIALRGLPTKNLHIRDANAWAKSGPRELFERLAAWFTLPVTLVLSLILALTFGGDWRDLAQFW